MSLASTIVPTDHAYPSLLAEIPDAPKRIFVRGEVAVLSHPCLVAVVGTRRCSPYGREMTTRLAGDLAKAGAGIVSGLALGIDTVAHEAALAGGAPTVAVLGGGVSDKDIYPAQNRNLAQRIVEAGGVLVSEYESGTPTYPSNFLARNRIIAALATGTLVTEAPLKSGALATARRALEYNRDVYALVGEATSWRAAGTNNLIKQGALCVTDAADILNTIEVVHLTPPQKHGTEQALSDIELQIVSAVRQAPSPLHLDALLAQTGLDAPAVSSAIIGLTLKGILKEREPSTYVLNN